MMQSTYVRSRHMDIGLSKPRRVSYTCDVAIPEMVVDMLTATDGISYVIVVDNCTVTMECCDCLIEHYAIRTLDSYLQGL